MCVLARNFFSAVVMAKQREQLRRFVNPGKLLRSRSLASDFMMKKTLRYGTLQKDFSRLLRA
jgi:hypothetical protein